MTNLKQLIQNVAKNSYKEHEFINEWAAFIMFTIVLKVAAMVFSIFAGYFYFNQLFISILNSIFLAQIFAIISLILIEVLVAISLAKFFKFALRMRLKALLPLSLVIIFFGLSFYSSINGLALRQSKKVDHTKTITEQYNIHTQNIKTAKKLQISYIKDQISTIKAAPQGWTNGKRSTLLSWQLKKIDSYFDEIKELEGIKQTELNNAKTTYLMALNKNNINQANESEKYYKIVSVIMVLIFLINGLLMYFYSRIFWEKEKDLLTIEIINNFSGDIQNKATGLIEDQIQKTFGLYFSAIQNSFDKQNAKSDDENSPFKIGFKKDEGTDGGTVNHVHRGMAKITVQNDEKRQCLYCGNEFEFKHWAKKYCSTKCRKIDWEKNNNKKLGI